MKQFLDFLIEFWPMLISGVLSVAAAFAGIISALNARRFSKYLDNAKKGRHTRYAPIVRRRFLLAIFLSIFLLESWIKT